MRKQQERKALEIFSELQGILFIHAHTETYTYVARKEFQGSVKVHYWKNIKILELKESCSLLNNRKTNNGNGNMYAIF